MSKYAMSKWFANGSGHVIMFHKSNFLLFQWNGRPDGTAVKGNAKAYQRGDKVFSSLAALLRSVEAEHTHD